MKEAPCIFRPIVSVWPLTHAITIRCWIIQSIIKDRWIWRTTAPTHLRPLLASVWSAEKHFFYSYFLFRVPRSKGEQGPVQQADLLMLHHASSVLQNSRGTPQCVWRVWGDEKRDTSLMTAALGAMNHFFLKTCPLVLHLPNATKSTRDQKS